jgi:hypothetical protein
LLQRKRWKWYEESLHSGKAEWQKKQEGRLDSLVKWKEVEKGRKEKRFN